MQTYTLATRPRVEKEGAFSTIQPLENLPLMTIQQARKACAIARANGHDVIVYNTASE